MSGNKTMDSSYDARFSESLGVSEHLTDFSKLTGASTWETWGALDFPYQFTDKISDPSTIIHFNLDGIPDVWRAVTDGSKGFNKAEHVTSWELYEIYSNPDVLKRTKFYLEGELIDSPF